MKKIVSVSLGSSKRNHRVEAELLGEQFVIERIGTDGDMKKLLDLIGELDGKVDAFGMGGIDLYLYLANKRYVIKDAVQIKEAAKITPMVDGSGLKNTLERNVIRYINEKVIPLSGKKVLMVSAVDRFGMAESLNDINANIIFGDLIFGLNIPIPIRSYRMFKTVAGIFLPIAVRMPFEKLYPTGKEQDTITTNYEKYYNEADVIAGDYLFIKKYLPQNMEGKIVITNTVTESDINDLRERGVHLLVTTTPEFNGRSFGTNVMEALLVSLLNKRTEDIIPQDYEDMLKKLNFVPRVVYLNETVLKEAR